MEIQAAASLFQVPIYECVQSTNSDSYHREVNHPVVGAKSSYQVKIVSSKIEKYRHIFLFGVMFFL